MKKERQKKKRNLVLNLRKMKARKMKKINKMKMMTTMMKPMEKMVKRENIDEADQRDLLIKEVEEDQQSLAIRLQKEE